MHTEALANKKHNGSAGGIDALCPIPADQLRREVCNPRIEKLKTTRVVFVGNRRDHRLQRQRAVELIDAAEQLGHVAVAARIARTAVAGRGLLHRFDAAGEEHRLPHALIGDFWMREREPVRSHIERHERHKRRHHDDRGTLPHARFEPTRGEVAGGGRRTAEGVGEGGEVAARGGRLDAGIEPPAEGVGAMREADGGLIQRDGGEVGLQPTGVAGECLPVGPAAGKRHCHRHLHLTPLGILFFDVLLLADRIERKHPDRPATADIVVEGGPGLRAGVRPVKRPRAGSRHVACMASDAALPHVCGEPLIEQSRFDEDRPGEHGGGGLCDAERVEEGLPTECQFVDLAATDEFGEVPAGQLGPDMLLPLLCEEVVGTLKLLPEKHPNLRIADAGSVGGIGAEGFVGALEQNHDLALADHVDHLLGRQRHAGPPHLGRGHGDRPRSDARHGGGGEGVSPIAHAQRLTHRGRIHRKRQPRREHVDDVVDHEGAKGRGQKFVTELRVGGDGDLGPVAGLRVLTGGDRNRDSYEV